MFYYVISALHRNVTVGPRRCFIPDVTMVEHACSCFAIKNDNGSEVCSPVKVSHESANIILRMLQSLYYLCIRLAQA